MDFQIRRLLPGDEAKALRVGRELRPETERDGREPSLQHLKLFLSQDTNYLIVASAGNQLAGFLTAYQMPDLFSDSSMVYLFEIYVAPPYRRQGMGRQLIRALKNLCQETDAEVIWVGTDNDNLAAKRLYESTGGVCIYLDNCEFNYDLVPGSQSDRSGV